MRPRSLYRTVVQHLTLPRMSRLIKNIIFDLRYGGFLGGGLKSPYRSLGANATMNTDYGALPYVFQDDITQEDVLLDVGCGKGRVINWWLEHYPNNKILGVEWNDAIAKKTAHRLRAFPNVQIISGRIEEHFPPEANILYFFNSFNRDLTIQFKDLLLKTNGVSALGRPIRLYYYCPVEIDLFRDDSRFVVTERLVPKQYFKVCIVTFA